MTIIKIHGCSGAGKTTAVRQFMGLGTIAPLGTNPDRPEAYLCNGGTYVLGSYENTCGGMDTVGTAAEVMNLLEKYAPMGNVIFEGLLQSTYYGKMGEHSKNYPRNSYIYAFLDTPIDLCLERVVERRKASGRNNKFNPQLTIDKWNTINHLRDKLIAQGHHRVVTLDHRWRLGEQIRDLL